MFVQFYYGLVGDKFHYKLNISGAAPFLKQIFLKSSIIESGACVVYNWVEKAIGWTTQYKSAIDSVSKANYSVCAYHLHLLSLRERALNIHSDLFLLSQDTDELTLLITEP